jgi:hypothetical protein
MIEARLSFQRSIPVRYEVDVFVAGGGPAGMAAAITAARQGCRVVLAEGHAFFGGMGTAALVTLFMPFTDGIHFLSGGFGEEIVARARKMDFPIYMNDPNFVVAVHPEALKRVYDDLALEAGITFSFQTQVIGVEREGGRVSHAICAAKSGLFAVAARLFIDCTGDGDLAAWAGASYAKGDEHGALMPGSLCSLWSDVDWTRVTAPRFTDERFLPQAFADGVFSVLDPHLPGMIRIGRSQADGNLVHAFGVDGTDERSVTAALVDTRRRLPEYRRYYHTYIEGFEAAELVATGSLLAIRETRRILGDYILGLADFKARASFPDEIGRYNYAVDVHAARPDPADARRFEEEFKTLCYEKGESYGIPYRILTPVGLDNLLVAGRCVSVDRPMLGSIRVMPACFITGQAAGMAAALAVETSVGAHQVDVTALQRRLRAVGAYLPNTERVSG